MRHFPVVFILILSSPVALNAQQVQKLNVNTVEVSTYKVEAKNNYTVLNMGYASFIIQNPEAWENKTKNKIVEEVDIVFTAYPKKNEEWLTNYDFLLNKRVEEIKKSESSLNGNIKVKWNYILQTGCKSEAEAKRMFHGAVLKYVYKNASSDSTAIYTFKQESKNNDLEVINNNIESLVYGISGFQDSVVFNTFNRNNWKKMLIVNDWTGSMYPYGAQAVLWHRLNYENNAVKYFIFFNDGNEKINRQKRIGNTGGIYYCKPDSIEYLLKVMKLVAKRGNGGDIPENNIEALLKAIRLFKGYDELVMIADNNAGVRDMILLDRVTVPVKIILCGTYSPIHPHYLEIARKTGGSIHTIEEDIAGLNEIREGEKVSISGIEYVLKKGKLVQANPVKGTNF
jgi:hypothetical protein